MHAIINHLKHQSRVWTNRGTNPCQSNLSRPAQNHLFNDPLTRLLPVDPTSGFLPPNVMQPKGEGSVLFTIQPQLGLVDGTTITNGATAWLTSTTATSGLYSGVNGHTYAFNSIARDALGNLEDAPVTPDAVTAVNTSTLQIERMGKQLKATWSGGTLEQSSSLPGGWTDAAVRVSPWVFTPTEEKELFRVHVQ